MAKRLLLAALVVLSSGCVTAEYEDASSQPAYAGLINAEFHLREVMLIHGVTLDPNYKKVVDVYAITPKPGIGGPEVLSREELSVGTTIRIRKVLRCINCFFGGGDELVVELPALSRYATHRMTLGFSFGGRDIVLEDSGKTSLNPVLFERIVSAT